MTVLAGPAAAVELHPVDVRTGTEGLTPAPLTIANAADAPIVCVGELAHWYSAELGRAEPGTSTTIPLWFDPATGTYTALNDKRENMPVEALWCGIAGRAYATRAVVALARRAGDDAPPAALTCTMGDIRLLCE
ncbi:MAG: hypothetical protein KDK07_04825 [Bauldia sp.]|nr:hypothetical protein [Bauldia sp.]